MKKDTSWKTKLHRFFFGFQQEMVRTSVIGKKMLTASRTNAHLKETYEELGRLLEKGMDSGEVEWESAKVHALLHTVRACKKDLEEIERQVQRIKSSAGPKCPQDIALPSPESKKSEDKKD